MTLKRLAVLAGCAMGLVGAQAADLPSSLGGQRPVYSVVADGGHLDARSFVQRLEGPRDVSASSRPARDATGGPVDPAAVPQAADPAASESPNLWLMGLGLLATGLVLLSRRAI